MRIYFYLFSCLVFSSLQGQSPTVDPAWKKINALSDDFTTLDCSGGGVYYLTNFGTPSWTIVNSSGWHSSGSTHTDGATCIGLNGTTLYAGTPTATGFNGGLYKSSSGGAWSKQSITSLSSFVTAIAFGSGSNVYVGVQGGVNYYNGTSWSVITSSNYWYITSLAVSGTNIFAGTYGTNDGGVNLYNGTSWTTVNSGLSNTNVTSLAIINSTSLVSGTMGGGIFYSSNNGTSWTACNGTGLTNLEITALTYDASASTLIAGTNGGVFYSTNFSSGSPTWTSANSSGLTNTAITSLAILTSGSSIVAGTNGGGVFYSTNYNSGTPTWTAINGSGGGAIPSLSVSSLAYDGSSKLYVGVCPKWRISNVATGDCCGGNNPSLVSVSNGILDLKDDSLVYYYANFLGQGVIETYNSKHEYGYYEIYAKPPYTATGGCDLFHSSFWMYYGIRDFNNNQCVKRHQEIDVFEAGGCGYLGTNMGSGGWTEDGSCGITRSISGNSYTYTGGYLYSGYHKYAIDFGPNRMVFYFDDVVVYETYNVPSFSLEGFLQVQLGAGLDNPAYPPSPSKSSYAVGDSLLAHFKIDYFYYYKLNFNCSTSITVTNNTSGSANTIKLTGANAYVPAVYSDISIAPSGSLSLSTSSDNSIFRAVNTITISPTGSGYFSVPLGETMTLLPTPCDH
ncbi:MAG TPA: family 16 glycosylhydrolase [Bacteroidia bacterium]|jgi:hypothetical protein|nr:family 16 glycosylhydrolase [Bacteroidia bacterium]